MNRVQGHNNILVVDDEPAVNGLIARELVEHGFVCRTATDSEFARRLIDGVHGNTLLFDLLIADVCMQTYPCAGPGSAAFHAGAPDCAEMPRFGGLELLAYVKRRLPDCKVVMITGNPKREYLSQALLLGAYDYIEKPFKKGELLEVVSRALAGKAQSPFLHDRAAAAIEQNAQAKEASLGTVTALVRAVEAKDPYTRRHSEQVAHYAVHIAESMGLSRPAAETTRVAALLHDIGKIAVPDYILTKPGPLTEEEFQCIRQHPARGADILAGIALFHEEATLIRHHHERWDGKGYPDGLKGEESPLISRIIQVSDSIDAMLMERTYKKGYPVEKMLSELTRCAGTQFDPRIAAAAMTWCQSHRAALFLPGRTEPAIQGIA